VSSFVQNEVENDPAALIKSCVHYESFVKLSLFGDAPCFVTPGHRVKCAHQCINASAFVKDALERVLGLKNPADLLSTVRSGKAMRNPQASRNVSARMQAKLRAKSSG
jgi:hypothetical protein